MIPLCACNLRLATHGDKCRECYEDQVRRQIRFQEIRIVPYDTGPRRADDVDIARMAKTLVETMP